MTAEDVPAALAPVRADLLATAHASAARELAEAEAQATAVETAAREQARAVVVAARAEGEELGLAQAARRVARARRDAREQVLAARLRRHEVVHQAARDRASALRDDPDYPRILARLEELALARLGPGAVVTESPAGGVTARAGSRQLDLTLPTLAEQGVEAALLRVEPGPDSAEGSDPWPP